MCLPPALISFLATSAFIFIIPVNVTFRVASGLSMILALDPTNSISPHLDHFRLYLQVKRVSHFELTEKAEEHNCHQEPDKIFFKFCNPKLRASNVPDRFD